jgi:integrase
MVNGRLKGSGKQKYPKIGNCYIVPFEEARVIARDYLFKLSQGIDPTVEEKKDIALKLTLEKAFEDYIDDIKDHLQKKSVDDYRRSIKLYLDPLKKMAIGEISVQDVRSWWRKTKKRRSDEIALMCASVVIDDYIAEEILEKNPFKLAKLSKPVKKTIKPLGEVEQHIPMNQLDTYVSAMCRCWSSLGYSMRDLVLFCLLTGKRLGESKNIKWKDVNFDEGVIKIEKLNTKRKKPDYVPMTPYLLLVLTQRETKYLERSKDKKITSNEYVFWSNSKQGVPVNDPSKCLKKIWAAIPNKDRFELEKGNHITMHDIRRTVSTASAELGLEIKDISSILAHSKKHITQKYIQLSIDYKREVLIKVQQYIDTQSNHGILTMLHQFYGSEHIAEPQPIESMKKSYREENKQWFND